MIFRHGIIISLLQRLRSWIAFNINFTTVYVIFERFCHLIAFMVYFCIFNIILKF